MRALLFIIPTILTNALAIPTPQADPIRTAPSWRIFEIADLKGPGCPDLNSGVGYRTHMNGGHNTVDGSEIYYAMIGYPHLRARLDEGAMTASTWCETTLTYKEYTDRNFNVTSAAYRLKPHKNGTEIGAVYDLDEGVNVNWKFTYEATGSKKIVDEIVVKGPYKQTSAWNFDHSENPKSEQWKESACGTALLKFRTELTVTADKAGRKAIVESELVTRDGVTSYYGTMLGFSYDYEKCSA